MQLSRNQRAGMNSAVVMRRHMRRTGLTYAGDRIWTDDEVEALKRHNGDPAALAGALPGRSAKAIGGKRCRLGLTKPRRIWTGDQERRMKPRYLIGEPVPAIATDVDKTKVQVWGKASKRKVRRPRKPPKPIGLPLYDKVRRRAFDLHLTMRDLTVLSRSRAYFVRGRHMNWTALKRAIRLLGGEVVIRWGE